MQQTKYAEVYYREYCDILTKNFRTYLEKELYIDLIFLCKYNKKVGAHQLVLGSFSTLLYKLFSEHQNNFKGHIAYVCVPDIRMRSMNHILKFIYYGKVTLRTKDELTSLCQDLELLDLPSHVVIPDSKSFCVLISGDRDSKEMQKPLETCTESDGLQTENESVETSVSVASNCVVTEEASSSLLIVPPVLTLNPQETNETTENGNTERNKEELVAHLEQSSTTNVTTQHLISSSTDIATCSVEQNTQSCNLIIREQFVTSHRSSSSSHHSSSKDKINLMTVLKNVAIACQDLETVGISDDENIRRHLQSCIRIVKHCITDINELLSTEVVSSTSENHKHTEKDWELKIMLENCLQHLPRLERVIECSTSRSRRHRRREKSDITLKIRSPKRIQ